MKSLILLLVCCFLTVSPHGNWGLLVAGSDDYSNYRHQSDVFHAYQILKKNGIPEDHIILMAYDDIATCSENPFPGKVFNKPNGTDVYAGVKINYKGDDVTPENFLAILKGDKSGVKGGDGKVIESTDQDNIFVFFSDHGDEGLICFPNSDLFADDLNKAINDMFKNKKYNKMVLYIESCYSGSMFDGLLKPGINVYAVSAADKDESSYATYCDEEAVVNGTYLDTCLGDEFSCNWMEHSDSIDVWDTKISTQFNHVAQKTKESHVKNYGEISILDDMVGDYQGHKESKMLKFLGWIKKEKFNFEEEEHHIKINSRDTKLRYLERKAGKSDNIEDYLRYMKEIEMTERSKKIFELFSQKFNLVKFADGHLNYNCYKQAVGFYREICGFDADRDARYMTYLASFCKKELPLREAKETLWDICTKL